MTNKPDRTHKFRPQKVVVTFEDGSSYAGWSNPGPVQAESNAAGTEYYTLMIGVDKSNDK